MRKLIVVLITIMLGAAVVGGVSAQDVPSPAITITSPAWGATVSNAGTISVSGIATNLFEGGLVVQALDQTGTVLAEAPVTAAGAALGGTGSWTAELAVSVSVGTTGRIYAYATSARDGSIEAQASVDVIYGKTMPVSITITAPVEGTLVNATNGLVVTGTTENIFEAQFMLQVRDANGAVLTEIPVTSSNAFGSGTWQVTINLQFAANTPGSIYAYDTSASGDGTIAASDTVNVTFLANCTPNTEWPLYTVAVGDNLYQIAQNTASTLDELVRANCIANPSVIVVGQQLRVPRLPETLPELGPAPVGTSAITILSPTTNASVPASGSIPISGTATALPGGLLVRLVDVRGVVIAEQTVVLTNVEAGETGAWQIQVNVNQTPGTRGTLIAYAMGGGAPVISNAVNVMFGSTGTTTPFITIDQPGLYAQMGSATFTVSGQAAGLFEDGLIVAAYDGQGRLLALKPATAAGLGQTGIWSVDLTVNTPAGSHGTVAAYAISPQDGHRVAFTSRDVVFGTGSAAAPFITIDTPLPGTPVRLGAGSLAGALGGLPSGSQVWVEALSASGETLLGPLAAQVTPAGTWTVSLQASTIAAVNEGSLVVYFTDPVGGTVLAYDSIPVMFQP